MKSGEGLFFCHIMEKDLSFEPPGFLSRMVPTRSSSDHLLVGSQVCEGPPRKGFQSSLDEALLNSFQARLSR